MLHRSWNCPKAKEAVFNIVKEYDLCKRSKAERHKPYGGLQPLEVSDGPFHSITMDFITDLPKSRSRYSKDDFNAILVIICRLTKYAKYIPWKKTGTAEELAHVFHREVIG